MDAYHRQGEVRDGLMIVRSLMTGGIDAPQRAAILRALAAVPGVTGAMVADAVPLPADRVLFEPSWSAAAPALAARARAGDLVLTMGAGDVSMVGPEVLEALAGRGSGEDGGTFR